MRTAVVVALTLVVASCASRAATTTHPSTFDKPTPAESLERDLRTLFTDRAAERAQWAVTFHSLKTANSLYSLNSARLMVPASAQKVLTAAAAAERLGWNFRYTTRVLSTAPIGLDGAIDGDVIVIGSGDPSVNPRHPERWRAFDDWAIALKTKGVTAINGRLIGDDNAFAEPAWGFGWSWDDLHYGFGAEPSALQFNENTAEVLVGPGLTVGSRAIVATSPIGSWLAVESTATTVAAGEPTLVDFFRMPGSGVLSVRGQIAADAQPLTLDASVENPTRFFVSALREALARHGISVTGGIADVDELGGAMVYDGLHELVIDQSPPLSELIDVMLKWSRNIYAESLLLSLSPPGAPATSARALQSLRETLRTWSVGADRYIARDGSGLSRYNYVTSDAMVMLLTYMWMDPKHAALFQSALPLSSVSGTLAGRMKGTAAEGRVVAKTGTMSHIRSLVGYVTTADGEPIAFSMIANDFRVPAAEIDAIMDRALDRVVQFKR